MGRPPVSETDSFIDEVTEEVRRDRLFRLWKKYGWMVIGVIVLAVAGAAVKQWLDHQAVEDRRAAGAALIDAAEEADPAARAAAFEGLSQELDGGAAVLANLRAATAHQEAGETAKALEILDAIAADDVLARAYTDMAAFRALSLRAADMAPSQLVDELGALAAPDAPYRLLALEARANALVTLGDLDAARSDMREILDDPQAPQGLAQRVQALLLIIGDGEDAG
jgi:hypothetical protein